MSGRRTLVGAMPMIVSAIAGGAKTRVVWGPFDTASTDGREIRMPLLPLQDEHVEAYALGYAVHETGHVVDTDFNVDQGRGLTRALFLILEDARIEQNRMRHLPGARRWLENLAYALLRDGRIGASGPQDDVPDVLCAYLLTHLWAEMLQFHGLREAADVNRAMLLRSLPAQVLSDLDGIAFEVAGAADTASVKALAVRMMQVLQSLQDRQPAAQGADNGGDGQPGNANDKAADQAQDAKHDARQGDCRADTEQMAQGDLAAGAARSQGEQQQGGVPDMVLATALAELLDPDACPEGKDVGALIAAGLGQALQQARGGTNAGDGLFTSAPAVFDVVKVSDAQTLIREVRRESLAVRARLVEFMQHETRARTGNSRSGQHLARDAGLRLACRNQSIYERRKVVGKKVDTAIVLLVDMSVSMRGIKAEVARRAALALAVALEEISGVQLAVYSFGGERGAVQRVIRFGETLRQTAGRLASMVPAGSTPLAEALMVAHADALSANAERRIVLPVTDGEPDNRDAVRQMVRFGERRGIEHIGLGIGADAKPAEFFRNSSNIAQVDELPRALVAIAQAHMFRNRHAA